MLDAVKKNLVVQITVGLFILLFGWWIFLKIKTDPSDMHNQLFAAVYGIMALWGGICGIKTALKWGGWKSVVGRSVLLLSIGLLAQEFGQLSYSFYIYFKGVEVPYPSIGDIGYFGSILLYICGVVLIGKTAGVKMSLKTFSGRIQALLIPIVLLLISYVAFLRGYEFDWSSPLTIFLDFGYPFGQALYVAIALLVYILTKKVLGGLMRMPIIILLFALVIQYFCDYTFLFQANRGTWYAGGINDMMYLISYTFMTLALINIGLMFKNLKKSDSTAN